MTASVYAAKPWLSQLSDAQRGPVQPPASVVHAFLAATDRQDRINFP